MKSLSITWIALAVGLLIALLLLPSVAPAPQFSISLPLLTKLILAEFGFLLTAIGAFIGTHRLFQGPVTLSLLLACIGCGLLSIAFLSLGITLWPGS